MYSIYTSVSTEQCGPASALLRFAGLKEPFPVAREVVEIGFERLRQGQAKGLIRQDVPVEFIWASFVGLAYGWFQLRDEYEEMLRGAIGPDADLDEAYLESLLKIFFEGIRIQP